jgi:hypothetical protein
MGCPGYQENTTLNLDMAPDQNAIRDLKHLLFKMEHEKHQIAIERDNYALIV